MEESDGIRPQEQHSNDSYRSEDHVQRHGNVKVESIIVDHTNSEEHGDHDPIVSGGKKRRGIGFICLHIKNYISKIFFLPQY